jgi:ribonuclease Z
MSPESQEPFSRRVMLGAGAAVIGWGLAPASAAETGAGAAASSVPPDAMIVTLLGTGSPIPLNDRYGMSTLIQVGGLNLVFDAGRGCTIRLSQTGVALGAVDALFITHFHSDHLNGLPDLWMTSYLPGPSGRRAQPLEIIGPKGIGRIAATMRETFADDVRIRMADEHLPEASTLLVTHEFAADGVVFERNGVTVTAFEVNHGPLIKPACGYRIDHGGRSVLLSGDTKFDENLIAHGHDVDLLVHEVAVAPKPMLDAAYIQAILHHHTTPEEAGTVFTRTKPRLAVFSHIVKLGDKANPPPADDEIAQRARTNWTGELVVGMDLDRFVVTSTGVATRHFDLARGAYPG